VAHGATGHGRGDVTGCQASWADVDDISNDDGGHWGLAWLESAGHRAWIVVAVGALRAGIRVAGCDCWASTTSARVGWEMGGSHAAM
jgi:hypothetical protein